MARLAGRMISAEEGLLSERWVRGDFCCFGETGTEESVPKKSCLCDWNSEGTGEGTSDEFDFVCNTNWMLFLLWICLTRQSSTWCKKGGGGDKFPNNPKM